MEAVTSPLCYNGRRISAPIRLRLPPICIASASVPHRRFMLLPENSKRCGRYAILGAGFAGLSVAWHLLQHSSKEYPMNIDIYDEAGLGGGASGVSGGLLHPYSSKAKLLWRGLESWKECLKLIAAAERAMELRQSSMTSHDQPYSFDGPIILRRGIIRPATTETKAAMLKENARNCLPCCALEVLDGKAAASLVPNLVLPSGFAIYMPLAMNIHPKRAALLPELSRNLPLRSCRGIIAEFELPASIGEYGNHSPSILSNAWLAFQRPRSVLMGSTWEWGSNNYSSLVTPEEAERAVDALLPKASTVYPDIKRWAYVGARAGNRAMPPLTPLGSLPLLGCVTGAVGTKDESCQYWLVGGLGSRGLLYHGLLGKLTAQAVISSDEAVLPSELTCWKRKVRVETA